GAFDEQGLFENQRQIDCSLDLGSSDVAAACKPGADQVEGDLHVPSHLDDQAVRGALDRHFVHALQHLTTKVAEQETFATQAGTLRGNLRIANVKRGLLVKVTALTNEQVSVGGIANQSFVPPTVAGIEQGFAIGLDQVTERNVFLLVRHAKGEEFDSTQSLSLAGGQFAKVQREAERTRSQLAIHRPMEHSHAFFGPLGAGNQQRPGARLLIEIFKEQKRQAPEVVPVQMTDSDEIYPFSGNTEGLECQQSSCATIEQKSRALGLNQVATLTPTTIAKRVARTENRNAHVCSFLSGNLPY